MLEEVSKAAGPGPCRFFRFCSSGGANEAGVAA